MPRPIENIRAGVIGAATMVTEHVLSPSAVDQALAA
jgi:hypothetical protein